MFGKRNTIEEWLRWQAERAQVRTVEQLSAELRGALVRYRALWSERLRATSALSAPLVVSSPFERARESESPVMSALSGLAGRITCLELELTGREEQ